MLVPQAEDSYQKGLDLLGDGHSLQALAFFSAALEIERKMHEATPQARYLSYYGLCISLTHGSIHEAVRCCRMAVKMEAYRPEMHYNLGRVLLVAGRRREAYKVLSLGLRLQPGHAGIMSEMKRMGKRRRPVLPFLSRQSPVNVFLGRLTRGETGPPAGSAGRVAARYGSR